MGSNSSDRTMLARNSILAIAVVAGGCHGCSIDCEDKKLCTDNIYGYYDSHCTGFLACTNNTQLCVEEDTPCNNTNTNAQLTEEELATPEQPEEGKGLLTIFWEFITHVTQKIF